MTGKSVQTAFIKPLSGLFKRAPGADEEAYFRLLKAALEPYEPEDLEAAAERIAREAETQTWPLIRVVTKACDDARTMRLHKAGAASTAGTSGLSAPMPRDAAMRILAAEAADLARRACAEDWVNHLIGFVADRHRIPDDRECAGLRGDKAAMDRKIEDHVAGGESAFVRFLVKGVHGRRASDKAAMEAMLRRAGEREMAG